MSGSAQRLFARHKGRALPAPGALGPPPSSAFGRWPSGRQTNAGVRLVTRAGQCSVPASRSRSCAEVGPTLAAPPSRLLKFALSFQALPDVSRIETQGASPSFSGAATDLNGQVDSLIHPETRFINEVNRLAIHYMVFKREVVKNLWSPIICKNPPHLARILCFGSFCSCEILVMFQF